MEKLKSKFKVVSGHTEKQSYVFLYVHVHLQECLEARVLYCLWALFFEAGLFESGAVWFGYTGWPGSSSMAWDLQVHDKPNFLVGVLGIPLQTFLLMQQGLHSQSGLHKALKNIVKGEMQGNEIIYSNYWCSQ